jgi:hypothetical protein
VRAIRGRGRRLFVGSKGCRAAASVRLGSRFAIVFEYWLGGRLAITLEIGLGGRFPIVHEGSLAGG